VKKMKFESNPFQLYPVKRDQLEILYIDRERELQLVTSVLDTAFESPNEVLPVLGDRGGGKSSTLNYIQYISEEKGYSVGPYTTDDDYLSPKLYEDHDVVVIDDLDKASDEEIIEYYNKVEKLIANTKFIFFSDEYEKKDMVMRQRESAISQKVPLRRLDTEKLKDILKSRMKNCIKEEDAFTFPFTDEAMDLASQRASNNLRAFIRYSKNAWTLSEDQNDITLDDMKQSIIMEDLTRLQPLSTDELKIVWYGTEEEFNLGYMADLCNMSRPTLDEKIKNSNLLSKERAGVETIVKSLYKDLKDGKEILSKILDDIGAEIEEVPEEQGNG